MPAVLFDFDFTLADSSEGIYKCFSYAMQSHGLDTPSKEIVCTTIGMSIPQALSLLLPGHSDSYHHLTRLFKERANLIMADSTKFYEQTPKTVKALRSKGYNTGIISTKRKVHIENALAREGFVDLFDVIIGADDVTRYKPDPEGIERAISILGCPKDAAMYVGDTTIDALAASAAGVRFIGVSTGYTPVHELKANGAEAVISSLAELPHVLTPREISDERSD